MLNWSLGGFDTALAAARAYDRAAIKFRGVDADINFNISDYEEDMNQEIKNLSKEDFVHMLRRHSNGFSRGGSKYRVMTANSNGGGLWEARMGQFLGNKAYGKAVIQPDERGVVMNLEANEREAHYGNGHNLDLNLRISTPSCLGISRTHEHMQLVNHGLHDMRSLQARGTTNTIHNIGGSSYGPSNSNWAWQSVGQNQTPTAAASSGFPAQAAPNYLQYYNYN